MCKDVLLVNKSCYCEVTFVSSKRTAAQENRTQNLLLHMCTQAAKGFYIPDAIEPQASLKSHKTVFSCHLVKHR